ncbi:oxidoreductase, short chain dehydrogenase/reductase family protein [Ditylenchus destructor]|nr:oxidoreductase, short chain dehydrogenase/reductase family protein [Ditylenchus destructor]
MQTKRLTGESDVVDADQKTDRRVREKVQQIVSTHCQLRWNPNPEFATVSGKYFDANGKEIRKSADAGDVRLQNRLWEASKQLCNGILFPENSNSIETNGHTNSIQTNSIPAVLNNVH